MVSSCVYGLFIVMEKNGTIFNTTRMPGELPQVFLSMSSVVDSPEYHCRGMDRSDRSYFFQYSISGMGMLRYGSRLYQLKPGSAIFSCVCDPALEYFYPDNGTEPWHFFWCDIEGEAFYSMAAELCRQYGPYFELPLDVPVVAELYEYSQPLLGTAGLDSAESVRMGLELLAALAMHGRVSGRGEDDLLEQALRYIQQNIGDNINASDVAYALNVSREHLSRLFKIRMGKSPYQVITEQKLNLSCTYLNETGLLIQDVAQVVGIPACSFSSWFRKHQGVTPREFRGAV